ncbi:MAG: VWA domain-containing protein [Prevotella sp.]|nr:VWA domain-containing protein [Prevotella sp.]
MLRFEDSIYLWLLLLIPILVLLWLIMVRVQRRRLRRFGDMALIKALIPDVSTHRPMVKFVLLLAMLAVLILMLARPQMGTKVSQEKRNGIEAIICMDISNSMKAEDVVPSRLDKSKMLVENLVDHFTNDKVGLVVFAGDAYVQLPITSDYVSAKMFLQNIDPSLIETQGTDVARAIDVAMHSFTQQQKVGRAIIVITDGEDHEGGALEAALEAKKKGINVFILGVGDPKGAPIPDGHGGYMTDASGQTVMSRLNEQMCQDIAKAGSGTYIHVDNTSDAQEQLNASLTRLQKGETSSLIYSEYDEQFQAFGLIVILLMIIEVCILEARNPLLKNVRLFKRRLPKA